MKVARILGILLAVGLVLLIIKWALITAAILAVPFGAWWVHDRWSARRRTDAERSQAGAAARRRAEVEGRAVVDAGGGCGWCGSRLAHLGPAGHMLPRDWHRDEIEALLQDDRVSAGR